MFPEMIGLGTDGSQASRLGFGCWQLGGHGWQDLDAQALETAVRDALDTGVNFFDTADVYGLGHSETALGNILNSHPKGKDAIVATKFGVRFVEGKRFYDNSDSYIREAVELSRKRLNRDCIELYQLHWPDEKTNIRTVFDTLEDLRDKKLIKSYGICNAALMGWKRGDLPAGLSTFSFEYSLVNRQHEKSIRYMQKDLGLTFLSWGSLAQGLLSGKYARGHKFSQGDIRARDTSLFADRLWDRYEPLLAALREVSEKLEKPMSQVALRWILDAMGGITLAGIKTPQHLRDNAAAFGWQLPADAVRALNVASGPFLQQDAAA